MGVINDPKKAIYNKVYSKTTISVDDVAKTVLHNSNKQSTSSSRSVRSTQPPKPSSILDVNHTKQTNINIDKLKIQLKLWFVLTIIILLISIALSITGIFAIVSGFICLTKYTKLKEHTI